MFKWFLTIFSLSAPGFCETFKIAHCRTCVLQLKEQYPVTAHACKRTLKNPFASRLAEFDTTLKLLRITDQCYIVPVESRFGQTRDFLGLLFIAVGRRTKRWEALVRRLKAYFFCQLPYKLK